MWDANANELKTVNIFDSLRVRESVARWVLNGEKMQKEKWWTELNHDPLFFCFGDTWGRVQWEMLVGDFCDNPELKKYDVYEMYVKPNRKLLMDMISKVSKHSAQLFIRERNKERKAARAYWKKLAEENK